MLIQVSRHNELVTIWFPKYPSSKITASSQYRFRSKLYHNNRLETCVFCVRFFSLDVHLTLHHTLNIVHMSLARAESSNILLYLKCRSYSCFSLNILHITYTLYIPCIYEFSVFSTKYPMSYFYFITWHLIFRLHFVLCSGSISIYNYQIII